MKRSVVLLSIESIVLGGPSTGALAYGFPVMLGSSLATLYHSPAMGALGLLQIVGCVWAFVEFWRLAISTALCHPHKFGARFWFGLLGAIVVLVAWYGTIPPVAIALLIGLPGVATAHFSFLQYRLRAAGYQAPQ